MFVTDWAVPSDSAFVVLLKRFLLFRPTRTRPATAYIVLGVYFVHSALDIATASPVT